MKREGVVTSKGQLVIPAELRRKHGIERGTRVRFDEADGGILVRPISNGAIARLRGILKGLDLPPNVERDPDREIE
ncbi:MAG: AbrB/MazE/SpoVT family DNA-binding domain-containing protein [Terriglobales bacterium]|jgi:AbrB family looped-hinge helix DNA binding protein